uniref:Putative defensin c n=1 Tax=Panstrongylus lignarius TaxID=156445 RepID=A0A224Y1Z4_9HEMI
MKCIIVLLLVTVVLFNIVQSYAKLQNMQQLLDDKQWNTDLLKHRQKRALCEPFGFAVRLCKSYCVKTAKEKGGRCMMNQCLCMPSHTPVSVML